VSRQRRIVRQASAVARSPNGAGGRIFVQENAGPDAACNYQPRSPMSSSAFRSILPGTSTHRRVRLAKRVAALGCSPSAGALAAARRLLRRSGARARTHQRRSISLGEATHPLAGFGPAPSALQRPTARRHALGRSLRRGHASDSSRPARSAGRALARAIRSIYATTVRTNRPSTSRSGVAFRTSPSPRGSSARQTPRRRFLFRPGGLSTGAWAPPVSGGGRGRQTVDGSGLSGRSHRHLAPRRPGQRGVDGAWAPKAGSATSAIRHGRVAALS
jgi:hypothetical protein